MEKATNKQKAAIAVLVDKLGLKELKADIVAGFTDNRTASTRDMNIDEAKEMLRWLKSKDPEEQKAEKMRRKIISMAHLCGYRFPGTDRIDMKKLDGWMVHYSYLHKKLNEYDYKELPELVTQFEKRYESHLKDIYK